MKKYKDYDYIAFHWQKELMNMFNGYVRLPKEHPLYKKVNKTKKWDLPSGFKHEHKDHDAIDSIDVHGGFTFAELITQADINRKRWIQDFIPGLWIGWDYAHLGDCFYDHSDPRVAKLGLGLCTKGINEKHWTIEEVEEECKNVIRQLLAQQGAEELKESTTGEK